MQEKVLATIREEVLLLTFNCKGKDMLFKDYLKSEVLPYLDLSKDTVMLKSGIEVSLKEFIEESILFTCQNRYHGDFIDFAKDNIVQKIDQKKEEKKIQKVNIGADDKTYVFYEELMGPKYMVIIKSDDVILCCRDGEYDIVMKEIQDKKDFLKRIKKLDLDLFADIYDGYEVFKNYVDSFSKDKAFYNSLMVGVLNKTSFDDEYDKSLSEISELINLVDSGMLLQSNETNDKAFDINELPLLSVRECLDIVMKKCRAFYSEFVNDIDSVMEQNNVSEKAEYVVDEYLVKIVNKKFYDYVSGIAQTIDNNIGVTLDNNFITNDLEELSINLRSNLKILFVNPNSNHDTVASEIYINIIVDSIQKKLFEYEEVVNNNIKNQLKVINLELEDNDSIRRVS